MISGMNTLLEDMIIVLGFRNMFLSICKIDHEEPSTVLEDVENWLEFSISTHFPHLEAGPAVQFENIYNQIGNSGSHAISHPHGCAILNILGYCSQKRHTIVVHDVNIEAYIALGDRILTYGTLLDVLW